MRWRRTTSAIWLAAMPPGLRERAALYRFGSRSGALMNSNRMSAGWNISLFHYRNHGADYGRAGGHAGAAGEMGQFGTSSRTSATPTGTKARTRRTSCVSG